jgi:hypothetical protein
MKLLFGFVLFLLVSFSVASSDVKLYSKDEGALCEPCQNLVAFVRDYLSQPDSFLINKLSEYCEELPSNLVGTCKAVVLLGGRPLIEFSRNFFKVPPKEHCISYGLCNSKKIKK